MKRLRRGFTLIELLVVIAVIAILAGLALPAFFSARMRSRLSQVESTIKNMVIAMEQYKTQFGYYPVLESDDQFDPSDYTPTPESEDQPRAICLTAANAESGRIEGVLAALNRAGFNWDSSATRRIGTLPPRLMDPWGRPYRIRYLYDQTQSPKSMDQANEYWNQRKNLSGNSINHADGHPWSGVWGSSLEESNWDYWIGDEVDYVIYSTGPKDDKKYPIFNVKQTLLPVAQRLWGGVK